ncbi:MAG: antirestriction protein [Zoogloeaceae bacterium]|nr:antirestriction protein [Zoogloeaceae bacterium]
MTHETLPFDLEPRQANGGGARITASIVPGEKRMDFLPQHFSARAMIKFEMSVYDWMGSLCPSYRGGFWNYVELSNGGAFMYPAGVDAFEFTVAGNGFHGTVTAEVAGIIATTFALNGMLWQGWDSLNEKYELLLEFIGEHPEAMTIRRALD